MRSFSIPFVTVMVVFNSTLSCNYHQAVTKRINATVIADTTRSTGQMADPVQHYDSIQIEFGDKLAVPYDSIYNLKLYYFIKDNLGKKCIAPQNEKYNCESFLATLFKSVYALDFPGTIAQQLNYKNFELFKDTSYLRQGDILFFKSPYNSLKNNNISHAGFYLHNGFFLVATHSAGVVITGLSKNYWSKHFVAAGRINKLSEENN